MMAEISLQKVEQPEKIRFSEVVEKAKKILPYEEKRVDLSLFKDLYGEKVIKKDLETIEKKSDLTPKRPREFQTLSK